MVLQTVIEKFTRHYRRWLAAEACAVDAPLVDADDLRELALFARSLPWSLVEFQRQAAHPLMGETLSFNRGRGFEFEENRAYQPGDEPRLLNWRLYARTGNLYTRVFSEERRPQVFLLVDRRAAMRFATRRQLKVTLAVKIAACYAYQAQHQALPVGGLLLDQAAHWFTPAMDEVPLESFVQSLVSACPPMDFERDQPDLEESLQLLNHRLPGGCFVLLVSDFADLDADSALPLLHQLALRHTLQAIQILDPVEPQLPAAGDFFIEDTSSLQPLRIDGRDALQQSLYTQTFKDRQSQLAACLKSCGIPLHTCSTQDDMKTCLEPTHADSHSR